MDDKEILKEVYGELYNDLVRVYHLRTICEVLREIYWASEDENIKDKVKEAMGMAKKMNHRLAYYWRKENPDAKVGWDSNMWKENPFFSKERGKERREAALRRANEDSRNDVR